MSGNSVVSALQTAPIVIGLPRGASAAGVLDHERLLVGRHQRERNVSLYLPIWTSSPSSRRWESMRRRLT